MIKTLRNFPVKEKNVLLRVDLNVPVKTGKVTDNTRLHIIKSTVNELCLKNNKVFLLSHSLVKQFFHKSDLFCYFSLYHEGKNSKNLELLQFYFSDKC